MKIRYVINVCATAIMSSIPLFGQTNANCFLNDFASKYISTPVYQDGVKTSASPTVTVTIFANDTIAKVSQYLYGNNANIYMSDVIHQPALLSYITLLSPNIIRYPGGNLSSVFFWDASQPPSDTPDSLVDGSSGKNTLASYWYGGQNLNSQTWTLSVDNYYTMLNYTGATGIITINYGYARYGTSSDPVAAAAHYAANWVRYDGGQTKFWEIGNEDFGNWQAGYMIDPKRNKDGQPVIQTGDLYGKHFLVYADSMRAAAAENGNPIYIGAVLYEQPSGTSTESTWDSGFFKEAGDAADFFIVHSYFTNYGENTPAATILNSATAVSSSIYNFVKQVATQNKVQLKPIALTEWNIFAVGSKQMCSFVNGMHAALVLGELAKDGFSMSSRWDLANGYSGGDDQGMFNQGGEPGNPPMWNPHPPFFYMYYFQKFFGDQMVNSTVTGSSNVMAYVSRFASGHAGVVVVNKGTTVQTVELTLAQQFGYGDRYYVYSLTGGTDNGDFSQVVYVNGVGSKYQIGGPIDTLTAIPASAYSTAGDIKFTSPPRSVQYILVEPGTNTGVENNKTIAVVNQYRLNQNYPNPFNPQTMISYILPRSSTVTLRVYDVLGREVAVLLQGEKKPAGSYQVVFDASKLSSGIYFYKLQTDDFVDTKKMSLVK